MLKHKGLGTKTLSLILSILMLLSTIPMSVFAIDVEDTNYQKKGASNINILKDIVEVEGLREESVKHFRLEDGTYIAAQYDVPVHYLDENGAWKDIDNTLTEKGGEFTTSNARIKFAKKITGNETLFTLTDGKYKLTMSLDGAAKKTVGNIVNMNDDGGNIQTKLQKMMSLENLSAKVMYENILDGVDIEYVIESYNVKENIIVKSRRDKYNFSFEIKLNNLEANLNEKGDIIISDSATGSEQYIIPAPIVNDANGIYADENVAQYSLYKNKNGEHTLTVTVDNDWMNAEDRAYPVVIDPPISVPQSTVIDLDISSSAPDSNYASSTTMYVSDVWSGYWKAKTLPTIPNSAYITKATISMMSTNFGGGYVGAYQVLSFWDETLTWNKTMDYPPQGDMSEVLLDYNAVNRATETADGRYLWNITKLVREWYSNDSENFGIGFKIVDGTSGANIIKFHTSETDNYPQFTIKYKDMKGVESYWTYGTQSAGFAGTGYINYATGVLTFGKTLLSTTDSIIPYAPSFVYSSALANASFDYTNAEIPSDNMHMPYGFKFSANETIIKKSYTSSDGDNLYMYILSDEDGTEHYFLPTEENGVTSTTKYQDDDGLQLILETSSTNLTITDNAKNKRYYSKLSQTQDGGILGGWYLSSISDSIGNKIIFEFENGIYLKKISIEPNGSNVIDYLTIAYNENNKPSIIWNETSKEAMIFRYLDEHNEAIDAKNTNYLRKIEYAHSTVALDISNWEDFYNNASNNANIIVDATAEYTYDSNGRMTKAKDTLSGYEIRYTYDNSGKVTVVQEYAGSNVGQKMSFAYYDGYTIIRSSGSDDLYGNTDDIYTRYTFDKEGRVKSMYSTDCSQTQIYGASSGVYEKQDNVKNNLKTTVVVGGSVSNYLLNGGFEDVSNNNASFWEKSSNVRYSMSRADNGGKKWAYFDIADNTSDSINQYTFLKEGEYTLSASINIFECENVKLYMQAESLSNSEKPYIEEVPINEYYASGDDSFASMTFSVGNCISGGDNFKISFYTVAGDVSENAYISVDNVMLERSNGASNYSMVQYGNFEQFAINANGNYLGNETSFWVNQDGGFTRTSTSAPFGSSGYISGEITRDKYLKQTVYTASSSELDEYDYYGGYPYNQTKTYVISGFAKGTGQVNSSNSKFGLRVDVSYGNL